MVCHIYKPKTRTREALNRPVMLIIIIAPIKKTKKVEKTSIPELKKTSLFMSVKYYFFKSLLSTPIILS